jgi:hypothetical protein
MNEGEYKNNKVLILCLYRHCSQNHQFTRTGFFLMTWVSKELTTVGRKKGDREK